MYSTQTVPVAQTLAELPAIVDNLLLLLSDKEKVVIKKRFDLFGGGKATLEDIGREFSVTRERVRQIEKNALVKMKRNVFNTALKNLHGYLADVVREHGGLVKIGNLLQEIYGVLPSGFKIDANRLNLSLELHENLVCVGNTINFHPYVRERAVTDFSLKYAANQLVNQLNKYGDAKELTQVHKDLKNVFEEVHFDLTKVKSLVGIDKRLALLDGDLVALLEWRHINPRTLRDKILYVLRNEDKPLHFGEISGKIGNANFDQRNVNIQAVHNELIRHDSFVLIGRGIYALSEWGFERGTVSEVIEKILAENKELDQDEIMDLVLKQRQVKKITVILALKNDEKFVRVGRKRYCLKK
ncbi:MAG: sigma factor-like helix-turn-helix DNA-binding protein [Patescibacteria group bacterium]